MKKIVVKCRKMLSMLLVISMLASMALSTAVFADEQSNGTGITTNGAYTNEEWVAGGSGSVTHNIDGTDVKLSKTVKPVEGKENTFEVTLKVETSTETTHVADSGAVVLVIDVSASMKYCANCGRQNGHIKGCDGSSRLAAAKTAALNFLEKYAGDDETANRQLAIVQFSTGYSTKLAWTNVAKADGYSAAQTAINGLGAEGGTNLEGGLHQALQNLSAATVSDIDSKSVVVLTDGVPTYRMDADGQGGWLDWDSETDGDGSNGSQANNTAAKNKADAIKNAGAKLYTVCFGVANNSTYQGGPTVGNFLSGSVASANCAYNADNTAQLLAAFEAISHDIVSGLDGDGWVTTDPIGEMFTVTGELPSNFEAVEGQTYKWTLHKSDVVPQGAITNYVYECSYQVVLNVQDPDFEEGTYYPTNGITYLTVDDKDYAFPVPGAQGTLPRTSVSVTKGWSDANNQDGIRPDAVTVQLQKDGAAYGEKVTLDASNNWTYTWTDLIEQSKGIVHDYTVVEDSVAGYTPVITGTAAEGYMLTNTHTPETITVSGQKTWKDAGDQDGIRPESITINLLADGVKVQSQTVTAENDWTWSFTAEKNRVGKEKEAVVYTVTEEKVEGYETEVKGYNVTNTHNPEKVNVSVKKVWDDADDQDGLQDDSVVIKLKADNKLTGETITLTEAGNWTGTFENLDKYKAGDEIRYTIEEVAINGYETKITGDMNVGYTVTNTHTPETITLTGSKTWVDNNNQDGIRPESIIIRLLADGNEYSYQTVAIAEDGSASWTFENLPKYRDHGTEIVYTITEDTVSEYTPTVDGMNVTNTHTPYETSVTVSKVWADNNDQDGLQPEDVTINLLADGNVVATQTLNEGNDWQHTFTELPVNANGDPIVYTVEEVEVEGYTATYTGDAETGYTVTNTHTPETITLTGSKEWDDNNNQDGKRPESITIRLLADGEQQEVYVASEENDWSWEFDNLPKYRDHGTEIIYTITEDVVEDYTAEIDGMNVTNTHTPEKTTVTVSKVWKDANNQDGIRPEKITVFLHADEYETDKSVVLNEENNWTAIFSDLPVYAAGQEIEYYVTEAEVEGYESVVTGDATIGYTITNIHEPATVEVAGTKTWKDNNNQDGKRPETITVNLIANGEKIDSVEVTEADGWAYKFENLPKFEAGEEVAYAVTENAVEGYTVTVDGYNLTNSYTPELTSVTVTKNWQDTNDKDGIRPDSITVRLLANGKDTGLVMKLTAEYKWVGMFAELPAYENGKKIEYTVAEDAVKDYNTVITGSAEKGFEITNSHTSVPKTGDDNNITLYASAAGVSVVALLAMAVILKKKKSEEI